MTDFVGRVLRPEKNDWIVRSLLDVDFYKFTMALFIFNRHKGVKVKFGLINRSRNFPLADIVDEGELRAQLDHVKSLRFTMTDLLYLRGQNIYGTGMFTEDFLAFLKEFQMTDYTLTRVGNQYKLDFEGSWEVVTFWETIALAIISELKTRRLLRSMPAHEVRILFARATDKLYRKLRRIKTRPHLRFADFAQRRRFSFLWQQFAIEMCMDVLPDQFTGTSNTSMAFNMNLIPIGTNAHELPMVLTALADGTEAKRNAQYQVLREWGPQFPHEALRIVLPDTYGSVQFWKYMPKDLAEEVAQTWRGIRQDSGNPVEEIRSYICWLERHGVDPRAAGKIAIASDGLDVDTMFVIDNEIGDSIAHPFGWGTMEANDFIGCHPRGNEPAYVDGKPLHMTWDEAFTPQSIVCKVETANGRPAVKLSNNINKATGPKEDVEAYLRAFGYEGRTSQTVVV